MKRIGKELAFGSRQELEHIYKALLLMEGFSGWRSKLPEIVYSWTDSLDFYNRIELVVKEHLKPKIASFKNAIPSLLSISDEDVFDAVVNNWPEALPRIQGQRDEILLCIAAHVANFIETSAYKTVLLAANNYRLSLLGLNTDLRDLLIQLLNASIRADNLFIRFLVFSRCPSGLPSGKTLEDMGASTGVFYCPEDSKTYTINELFPTDTRYLSRHFGTIADKIGPKAEAGMAYLRALLRALSGAFAQIDVTKIESEYRNVNECFIRLIESDSPLYVVPSGYFEGGYEIYPYHDPEIRIGLSSPQCAAIEKRISDIRRSLSQVLQEKNYLPLSQLVDNKRIRVINSIGDYGVNLKRKAMGQSGSSSVIIYFGEQIKAHREMRRGNTLQVDYLKEDKSPAASVFPTVLHELCHFHLDMDVPETIRLGRNSISIIQELEAELVWRWLIPDLLRRRALDGSEENWAALMVENSLTELKDKSEANDPEYFYPAVYSLRRLFADGILVFDFRGGRILIRDINAFYKIQEEQALEILSLFADESMTPQKAERWISEKCSTSKEIEAVLDFLKQEKQHNRFI